MKLCSLLLWCGLVRMGVGFYTTSPEHTPRPQTVQFSDVRPRSVRASWDWNITHPVKFFEVEVSQEGSRGFVHTTAVPGHERSVLIPHLRPHTPYRVTVRPRFFIGWNTRRSEVVTTPEDSVLLSGGPGRCFGTLEEFRGQSWNKVCRPGFRLPEAALVCEELDCGEPLGFSVSHTVVPDRSCHGDGTEASLKDCKSSDETRCSTTVSVTCSDEAILRLDGFRCYGNPQLRHKDEWRRVMITAHLDLDFGSALCERIGCGVALSLENLRGFSESFWILEPECVKKRTGLTHCLDLDTRSGLEIEGNLFLLCSEAFPAVTVSVSFEDDSLRLGSNFSVSCSLDRPHATKQFHLESPTGNYTLPSVNHSAHFLFHTFSPAHIGNYTCSYCESFTFKDHCFQSTRLFISPGAEPQEKTVD